MEPMTVPVAETDVVFKAFPHLNLMPVETISRSRMLLRDIAAKHFNDDVFVHKIVRALAQTGVLSL
jgi:hypothetical protein